MEIKTKTKKRKIIKIITLAILLTTLITATLYYIKPVTANAEIKEYIHNFTESGKSSDFYSITGNLTTIQGNVTYNNLTLTTALKMESSTFIQCEVPEESILTLVFNSNFNGNVNIAKQNIKVTNGILQTKVDKGTLYIQKGDTANLYYISLKPVEQETETPTEPTEPAESETEATLETIQDTLNILIAVQMVTLGAFLGYVAISRLM